MGSLQKIARIYATAANTTVSVVRLKRFAICRTLKGTLKTRSDGFYFQIDKVKRKRSSEPSEEWNRECFAGAFKRSGDTDPMSHAIRPEERIRIRNLISGFESDRSSIATRCIRYRIHFQRNSSDSSWLIRQVPNNTGKDSGKVFEMSVGAAGAGRSERKVCGSEK